MARPSIVVITSTAPLLWPEFLRLLGTVVSGITNSNTIKPALLLEEDNVGFLRYITPLLSRRLVLGLLGLRSLIPSRRATWRLCYCVHIEAGWRPLLHSYWTYNTSLPPQKLSFTPVDILHRFRPS